VAPQRSKSKEQRDLDVRDVQDFMRLSQPDARQCASRFLDLHEILVLPLSATLPAFRAGPSPFTVFGVELTDEELQEFQAIWKQTFKEDLSLGDARHCASQLIELYTQLAKPLPSERASFVPPSEPCATSSIAENPPRTKTAKSCPSNHSGKK
jgi:hypothetical protein